MKAKKISLITLILLGTLLLLISGCAQQEDRGLENTLSVGMVFEPGNLDPAQAWNGWFVVQSGMGETLFKLNHDLEVEPWLVEDYQQLDELNWELELKEGIKFHDGTLMDSEAVKASLKRSLELNERAPELLKIESIELLDERKLKISTTEPNPMLINALADPLAVVVNAQLAEELGSDFAQSPSLTGPYKLADYREDVEIVVEKNEDYWNTEAQLEEINFKFISDGMSRVMALQAGEIDIAQNIPAPNVQSIASSAELDISSVSSLRTHMLYLNLEKSPLDDLEVRKAISSSIDRNSLAEQVMQGAGVAGVGPFSSVLPFGGEQLEADSYDLELARNILAEADWELNENGIRERNGEKLELTLHTYEARPELPVIAETIQAQLKELGIAVKIEVVESISNLLQAGNFEMAIHSMNTAPIGDPQYFLELVFRTGASSNFSRFSDAEVDQIIEELNSTFDIQARQELAAQVQEKILEVRPSLALVYPKVNMGVRAGLEGYSAHPSEFYIIDENVSWK